MIDRLSRYLRMTGQCSSAELADFLSVSVSTVSRQLTKLIDDGKVVRLGQGKNVRYIYLRAVKGVTQPVLVRQVDENAVIHQLGKLWIIDNGSVLEMDNEIVAYDDLPWFFFDLKPQGFIGRLIGKRVASNLQVSPRVDSWSSDDVLRYLVLEPNNTPGNFELYKNFDTVRSVKSSIPTRERILERYETHLTKPMFTEFEEAGGSSAGGEQPKFNALLGSSKIVKYSQSLNVANSNAERVKDLLICEHHALNVLREYNGYAAETDIFVTEKRAYLEVKRFDRTVVEREEGQIGMVSLESVIAEFIGYVENWSDAADKLLAQEIIKPDQAELLKLWLSFSRLIGNTDTHNGNVSLFLDGITPSKLTPAYDILPMAYMPNNADIPTPKVKIVRPDNISDEIWQQATLLAGDFWQRVSDDSRVSESFKTIASDWLKAIL
ncbi:HipA domain-containing protein [Psychrobium sp. MM17-31]|uniref:HipA domain-containing protein n=1 Tax=Psychrobium sp. MM17-31 TaxID=2917758 RepID=UPI001EF4DDC0|nr:HipA domain-containing protein [Psychrobium sp. MM17-31]MCG7532043.1 HipA domain-containing protein [Psychrobium sp. MM17-31]